MSSSINILATKKLSLPQKEKLYHAGFSIAMENFIAVSIKNFELAKVNDNLIFTSQNAVQSIVAHPKYIELKNLPAFCVGEKTKQLLEKNGFKVDVHADYAADLAEIISLVYANESFTFFSGNLRRDILPETLRENGIQFNEIEVYETTLTPHQVKNKPNGILFFSPSAVESYLKKNKITQETCFCIGETTAEALEDKNIKNIVIAEEPTIESVIQTVINEYA